MISETAQVAAAGANGVIDHETLIPLGIVVSVLLFFVGGVWKIANTMTSFGHRLDMMEASINGRLKALEDKPHGMVSRHVLRAWIAALRAANPQVIVPVKSKM
jgi:hypothetical protein